MNTIMRACIILHNMIIESERGMGTNHEEFNRATDPPINENREVPEIDELMKNYEAIRSKPISLRLQNDLVEHLWTLKGNREGPYAHAR